MDETNITVKNMNDEVALNGTVPSYRSTWRRLQPLTAASVSRTCTNHLWVALPPGDDRDDATLTTMANNALALNITSTATH